MATTKVKDGTHLKEKSPSSSHSISTSSHDRQTRKPSIGSSPDLHLPMLPEKPIPHYLKPKTTPSTKTSQPPPSTTPIKRHPIRKPIEKPPSPSRQPQRTATPVSTRDKAPKPPSPIPRSSISPIPNSDRTPKNIVKSGRSSTLTRTKSLESRTSTAKSGSATGTTTLQKIEALVIKPEQEENELPSVDNVDIALKPEEGVLDDIYIDSAILQLGQEDPEVTTVEDDHKGDEELKVKLADEGPKEVAVVVAEPPKVKLWKEASRRAVGERRKEGQKSNEVIEEAKSKLMEKRKSKVLALVGAFETVISLQEPEGSQQGQPERKNGEVGSNAAKESE